MSDDLFTTLDQALQGLAQGESVETVCARYPAHSAELRPLLETARLAQLPGQRAARAGAQAASRAQYLARAAELKAGQPRGARPASARLGGWLRSLPGRLAMPRSLGLALATSLVFVFGAFSVVAASTQSLPGEPLYSLKRSVEQVQLLLSPDEAARAALEQQFDDRRLDEAQHVAALARSAALQFGGRIESQTGERWQVAGLHVIVRPGTPVSGTAQVGLFVEVDGTSQPDGTVLAAAVDVTGVILRGRVRATGAAWDISGQMVQIGATTVLGGAPRLGDEVEVNARRLPNGALLALVITQMLPEPTAGPTLPPPVPGGTPTSPNPATPPAEAEEVRLEGVVQAIGAQAWQVSGQVILITASTEIRGQPQIGRMVEVRALQAADGTLTATRIEARAEAEPPAGTPGNDDGENGPDDSGAAPGATGTPEPDSDDDDDQDDEAAPTAQTTAEHTPEGDDSGPSATGVPQSLEPSELRFEGTLESTNATIWVIDGQGVGITEQTEIDDDARVGDRVEVRAVRLDDGSLQALRIVRK